MFRDQAQFKSCFPHHSGVAFIIFIRTMLTHISRLHLGQYNGKLTRTVSG